MRQVAHQRQAEAPAAKAMGPERMGAREMVRETLPYKHEVAED